ncbi:hypothetical protein GQ473_01305 [archaeon]|nr:hypothetical protein [archaeon]
MNTQSRTITGIIAILLGLIILNGGYPNYILSTYGLLFIVIGIVIFLNKKEDDIEKIKSKKGEK